MLDCDWWREGKRVAILDLGDWGLVESREKSAMLDFDVMIYAQIRGAVNQSDVTGSGSKNVKIF